MKPKAKKTKKPFRLSYRNRTLTFTPLGTRFIIVCVLVGMAAINTGSNLLYLCTSMMLSLVIVSGILSEQSLKKLKAKRSLPDEIYAQEPFAVRYEVENRRKHVPSYALGVTGYPGGTGSVYAFMLSVAPGEKSSATAYETLGRRGPWLTEGFELSTRFPFGLFGKSLRVPAREERIVYPPIRELPAALPRSITRGYGEAPAGVTGQGAELRSLRDHQSYDEARLIHWKSSARLSRLLVKEMEAERKRTVTVVLDDAAPAGSQVMIKELFEEGVALAAAVSRSLLLEHDVPVSFISRGFMLAAGAGRGQYLAVMEGLALVKPYDPDATCAKSAAGAEDALVRALGEGPCVMVLPARGSGWSSYADRADLVLEAGV